MKNFLNKAMLTLVVFGLAIVSSFAMETDPPTEPVKTTVEMEITEDVQPPLVGYGYKISPTQCVFLGVTPPSPDCHQDNNGDICIEDIGDTPQVLYYMSRATSTSPWVCIEPLKKPLEN